AYLDTGLLVLNPHAESQRQPLCPPGYATPTRRSQELADAARLPADSSAWVAPNLRRFARGVRPTPQVTHNVSGRQGPKIFAERRPTRLTGSLGTQVAPCSLQLDFPPLGAS